MEMKDRETDGMARDEPIDDPITISLVPSMSHRCYIDIASMMHSYLISTWYGPLINFRKKHKCLIDVRLSKLSSMLSWSIDVTSMFSINFIFGLGVEIFD